MNFSVSTTRQTKDKAQANAKALGMSLSGYINYLVEHDGKTVVSFPESSEAFALISSNHDILTDIAENKSDENICELLNKLIENDREICDLFSGLVYKVDALMHENNENGGDE